MPGARAPAAVLLARTALATGCLGALAALGSGLAAGADEAPPTVELSVAASGATTVLDVPRLAAGDSAARCVRLRLGDRAGLGLTVAPRVGGDPALAGALHLRLVGPAPGPACPSPVGPTLLDGPLAAAAPTAGGVVGDVGTDSVTFLLVVELPAGTPDALQGRASTLELAFTVTDPTSGEGAVPAPGPGAAPRPVPGPPVEGGPAWDLTGLGALAARTVVAGGGSGVLGLALGGAFLLVQGAIDRRDPKLALAPLHHEPDLAFPDPPEPWRHVLA